MNTLYTTWTLEAIELSAGYIELSDIVSYALYYTK